MRILLADPPQKETRYHLTYPNIGILYLISYLRKHLKCGDLSVSYLEGHCNLEEHVESVRRFNPDVYGISFATETTPLARKTVERVRGALPSLKIVCGGAHPSAAPMNVLHEMPADVCVVGEGEETLLELATSDFTPASLSRIDGIVFKENGDYRTTRAREFNQDIETFPFPAWDLIDFARYPGMHFRRAVPQTYMLAVRGCPYHCVFCSNPVWRAGKPWARARRKEGIKEEVSLLYHRGVREIYFSADEFNVDLDWAIHVCEELIGLGFEDLHFQCNLRVDRVNDDFARALKAMNVWLVHVGIESANQRVLDGIRKKITVEQVLDAVRIFKRHGIKVFANMMLFQIWEENGELCHETSEEVKHSLRFVRRLYSERLINYLSWQFATPYPGSALYDVARRRGLLINELETGTVREPTVKIPGVSRREMIGAMKRGLLLKNYYALKSGNIEWRHWQRIWENVRAMARI
ncbi:MAG: radical SAM protein [Candidatus Eisenbacteria bacterium]